MFKVKFRQNRGKIRYSDIAPYLGIMRALAQLPAVCPGICLTAEKNKTGRGELSQGSGIVLVGHINHNNIICVVIFVY